jgi:outer membrane protein assembly factor BamE (lipoprotein component of BamABCDE complex)
LPGLRRAVKVASQRGPQLGVAGRQPVFIGADSAVKGFRHALDMTTDAQITGADLAQRAIEIGKHRIEEPLRERRGRSGLAFEPVQIQKSVQADQLKAPVERIGDTLQRKEFRPSRLGEDQTIGKLGGIADKELTVAVPRIKSARNMGSIDNRFNIAPARHSLRSSAVLFAVALSACAISEDQRGNLPDPDKLAEISPGNTTKEQVVKILGSPSSASTFDDQVWYYISRKTKQVAFLSPTVLDQQVYIVDFDDKGVVKDIGHKTLADGANISPAPGATPSPGRELSFMEQLIGNIGRFGGSGGSSPASGVNPGPSAGAAGH